MKYPQNKSCLFVHKVVIFYSGSILSEMMGCSGFCRGKSRVMPDISVCVVK